MDLALVYKLIKHFEGCILSPYLDAGGIWTCGWGTTGADVIPGVSWSQEYADKRLEQDISRFTKGVLALYLTWNSARLCALVDFAYNLGLGNLRASTLLRKLRADNISGAAQEFKRWVKCNGRILPGLVARRAAERALFLTG